MWITTSWDDGHVLDLRLADMLDRHGLTGTFYVARDYLPERMSEAEIAHLSARHEIGAHTLTHPVLTEIEPDAARREIVDSRRWLQDVTGSAITAFCPPRGATGPAVRHLIAEAGYVVARSVEQYHLDTGPDPLDLPTTVHLYPFPLRPSSSKRARFQPIQRVLPHVIPLRIPVSALRSWPALALALLDRAAALNGVWHLWGHSWEIDRFGLWDDLERVLAAASRYRDAHRVTNTALIREKMNHEQPK
jgi:hypothetical protein